MYDPCGTQRLEGNDIINRMAKWLQVDPEDLAVALKFQAEEIKRKLEDKPNDNER